LDEKNFIKEKIVGQKISWKKKVVKALSFLFSGGVFGLGIFLVLFFLLPILPEKKEGKEKETVAFTEEASTEAESGTEKTEAIEDVVQSEIQKLDFPISAYDSMMGNLKSIIQEGEKSLVEVMVSSGGEDLLHESVISSLLSVIGKNIPTTSNPNYPNTMSISIDSHEVGFKTDSNIAFGWREVFDREKAKTLYKFRASFVNISTAQKDILAAMETDGWYNIDFNKQKRFWNNVEGKNPRYNKRKNYSSNEQEQLNLFEVDDPAKAMPEPDRTEYTGTMVEVSDNPMAEAFKEAQEKVKTEE